MSRCCAHEGCGAVIRKSNITGMCQRHAVKVRPVRNCQKCNSVLGKGNSSGTCRSCKAAEAKARGCNVCGKQIAQANITGLCVIHYRESIGAKAVVEIPARIPAFSLKHLLKAAANFSGISVERLCGEERRNEIVTVRQAIAMVGRSQYSATRIAQALHRDHSTILHAMDRAEGRMDEPRFAHMVEMIKAEATAMKDREISFARAEAERLAA